MHGIVQGRWWNALGGSNLLWSSQICKCNVCVSEKRVLGSVVVSWFCSPAEEKEKDGVADKAKRRECEVL